MMEMMLEMMSEATLDSELCRAYLTIPSDVPKTLKAALMGRHRKEWEEAARKEMESFGKHSVYTLVHRPANRNTVGCRAVLAEKKNTEGKVIGRKVRFVAQGFSQRPDSTLTRPTHPSSSLLPFVYFLRKQPNTTGTSTRWMSRPRSSMGT
uniref:Integrase n=1 Tax=Phaffia rhodozyma TaxID=264483 RepID=A0A1C9U697_PHARH|nr:integrase [Phaffia rhodozyma]